MNHLKIAAPMAAALLMTVTMTNSSHAQNTPLVRFGIITDMHHTNKPDTATRKYSASLDKGHIFIKTMEADKAKFIVELGDFVDTLAEQKDPQQNLQELEKQFTSFSGPAYHVLGNHEFDNVTRELFLSSITNQGIDKGQTYYSWDAGGVHFIVLDAGYTNTAPHRAFDMNTPEDTFWTWKDAFIPEQETEWLKNDLKASNLPTIVFTHQTMDRVDEQDHNIKNASQIRKIFEDDGQVLAVFSGHDHQGGYSNIKGIHYIVLHGNVGVSDTRSWLETSSSDGYDKKADNQFSLIEVSNGNPSQYTVTIHGYGRQPSYELHCSL
ncbi:metallophosphoesterase [Desulfogranum japonicum]|uniref:metallophosphoesterase n=1 Tax=Desulfogranum japonicum TaxID=231447 RepID=UPI001378D45F|nr:metallophosphoesterase [Desulfogranum japonicum]